MNSPDSGEREATTSVERAPDPLAFERHVEDLTCGFERQLRRARKDVAPEAIHQLRVLFKRLRAAISALRLLDPEGQLNERLRPLKRIFKTAGPLRDSHVHWELLYRHAGEGALELTEVIHLLTARELCARFRFLSQTSGWKPLHGLGLVEAVHRITGPVSLDLEWHAQSWFAVEASRLADLAHLEDLAEVDLHRVRRVSKDARYLLALIESLRGRDASMEQLDLALREVHRALGAWHDATTFTLELERFAAGRVTPLAHPPALEALVDRLKEESRSHRERFEEAFGHMLNRLGVSAA